MTALAHARLPLARPLAPPLGPEDYARLYALRKTASTQTANTTTWLCAHARALTGGGEQASILSIGTGEGDVELPLLDALAHSGVDARLDALEPNPAQRERLAGRIRRRGAGVSPEIEIWSEPFERYATTRRYELVLMCQSAYYFDRPSLPFVLRRAWSHVAPGGSLVIVHQSAQGVPEIQARHMLELRGNLETMLCGDDLALLLTHDSALPYEPQRDRIEIPASLDLSPCLDPSSAEGVDIMSFCLECDLRAIDPRALAGLRASFAELARDVQGRPRLMEPVDVLWLRRPGRPDPHGVTPQ